MRAISGDRLDAPRSDHLESIVSNAPAAAWVVIAIAYYVPLLTLRILVPADQFDSEFVSMCRHCIGICWPLLFAIGINRAQAMGMSELVVSSAHPPIRKPPF